jgi:hypothetical protein
MSYKNAQKILAYFSKIFYDTTFQEPSLNYSTVAPSSGIGTPSRSMILVAE